MTSEPGGAIRGRALLFGDHVNADVLHPSSFFSLDDDTVASGFLGATSADRRQARRVDEPIVVVAGRNFGCGSSRETTVRAFQLAGVRAVVAESFGRLFLRNLLAIGLEGFELTTRDTAPLADGDLVEIDAERTALTHLATDTAWALRPRDPFLDAVSSAGGLLELLASREIDPR